MIDVSPSHQWNIFENILSRELIFSYCMSIEQHVRVTNIRVCIIPQLAARFSRSPLAVLSRRRTAATDVPLERPHQPWQQLDRRQYTCAVLWRYTQSVHHSAVHAVLHNKFMLSHRE
jgi:hypothetical protein